MNGDYIATVIDPDHYHFRKTTKFNSSTSIYARSYTITCTATALGKSLFYVFPKTLIGNGNTATP